VTSVHVKNTVNKTEFKKRVQLEVDHGEIIKAALE
jgi:hypothetical protein